MPRLAACLLLFIATAANAGTNAPAPEPQPVPAGDYKADKPHTSVLLRVNHLGFSNFTARFTGVDAALRFDPARLTTASVKVHIDPNSISSDNAPDGFLDIIRGKQLLDTAQFPTLDFRSTSVEQLGANNLRVKGDLTLHGVTKPVVLEARYNGGYAGHPMDPHARIGFSAHGKFKRSDFGVSFGVPGPGTPMGVGDEIEVIIETEFSGPPLAK
jgi:polyisoprenoid-binding protein YceI